MTGDFNTNVKSFKILLSTETVQLSICQDLALEIIIIPTQDHFRLVVTITNKVVGLDRLIQGGSGFSFGSNQNNNTSGNANEASQAGFWVQFQHV